MDIYYNLNKQFKEYNCVLFDFGISMCLNLVIQKEIFNTDSEGRVIN